MKKRLLSLLVAIAMIASIMVIPISAFADSADVFINVDVTHNGSGNYTVKFDVASGLGQGAGNFQVFAQQFFDEDGSEPEDALADFADGNYTKEVYEPWGYPYFSDFLSNVRVDEANNGVEGANTFNFSMDPTLYETNGTTYYLYMKSNKSTSAYLTFQVDTNGDILADQTPIAFELDGGSFAGDTLKTYNSGSYSGDDLKTLITALGEPTKSGYKFKGWSETADDTVIDANTATVTLIKDTEKTFYAVWQGKDALTNQLSINPISVDYNGASQKPTIVYGETGITDSDVTIKYDGTESTDGQKNAKTYAITVSVAETENYKAITDLSLGDWTINKADYTYTAPAKQIAIGDSIVGTKIPGTLNGVVSDDNVTGNFVITDANSQGDADGKAEEGGNYTGLTWTFEPAEGQQLDSENYNTPGANDAVITVIPRTVVTPNFTVPTEDVTYGDDYTATASPSGTDLQDDDYTITYVDTADNSESAGKPTDVGTYKVKVTLTDSNFKFEDGTTVATSESFTIVQKEVSVKAQTFTKEYDGTTDVKVNGNALQITDLELDGVKDGDTVNLIEDVAFTAAYNASSVAAADSVTIGGVKLDNDNYELNADSLTMDGTITAVEITATLKDEYKTKTYGQQMTLDATSFEYSDNFVSPDTEAELDGVQFESDATDANADVKEGGYEVTIKQQPTNTNYTVKLADNQVITVTPETAVIEVTPKTDLKYKGEAYTDEELSDVTVTVNGTQVTLGLKYSYTTGAEAAAEVKNAGDYGVKVELADEVKNYTAAAAEDTVTIGKAEYTAAPEGTIDIGDAIVNTTITGKLSGVVAADDVNGTFTITDANNQGDAEGKAEENGNYENLSWTFAPEAGAELDDVNYNTPTGTNGKLTVNAAPATATPTAAPATATPTAAPATATPSAAPATATPTAAPATATPTAAPATATPTAVPATATPSAAPATATPSAVPATATPSAAPTGYAIKVAAATNGSFTYAIDDGEAIAEDSQDVAAGSTVKVTTKANSGYTFDKMVVTKTDGTTVEVKSKTFTMPESDVTIEVTFKKSANSGGGGGSGNSGISTGSTPTATPTAAPNVTEPTSAPNPVQTLAPGTEAHTAYVYGYEDGDFRPENGITRAETAAIFARALSDYVEGTSYTGTLSDVPSAEWYTNYVNYLAGVNVITGYEDGTFRPDNNISRREFTAMITRLGEVLEANGIGFSDVASDDWGADYIYTASVNGLVDGYEDGTFRPDNSITRAEAVKIVNAYLNRGVDAQGLASVDYVTFPDVTTAHWAYYEIIEAANNHIFEEGTLPEIWKE